MQRVELRTLASRIVLLDLDGTVWDSRPWYAMAIARLSGCEASDIEAQLAAGASVIQLARQCGVGKTQLKNQATGIVGFPQLYDGVVHTLERLRDRETRLGVVSNLSGSLAVPLLHTSGLDRFFDTVVTPGLGIRAKPQPHGILRALRDIGRKNGSKTWYVGDGVVDANAAQAAKIRFAWASYGYENEEPEGVDTTIDQFEEVLQL